MRLHHAALAVILFTATGVFAQAPVMPPTETVIICPGADPRCPPAQPLPAAGIPETKKGVFDWFIKAWPAITSFGIPIIMVLIKIGAPHLVAKIPGQYLPLVSTALSSLTAAAGAIGADVVLNGGGVDPGVAAIEGLAAGPIHYSVNKAIKKAEDQQADVEAPGKKG